MTEVNVADLDELAARRITTRIQGLVESINGQAEKLVELVTQAYAGRAWIALGCGSWQEYVETHIPAVRLDRVERRELVSSFAEAGMSTRAIAPVIGADQKTVSNDLRSGEEISSPIKVAPRPVTGVDGKTYTFTPKPAAAPDPEQEVVDAEIVDDDPAEPRPQQDQKPRRKPLADTFREASWDLWKKAEALQRLTADDRFPRTTQQVSSMCRGDLQRTVDALNDVINHLSTQGD